MLRMLRALKKLPKFIKSFVKSAIVRAIILPLIKRAILKAIREEGDRLQEKLKVLLELHGLSKVGKAIDSWQKNICKYVQDSWLPDVIEDRIIELVKDKGDELQARLELEIEKNGPRGIDKAIDWLQAELARKVAAI